MANPLLTIEGLSLRVGNKRVIEDLSFTLPPVGMVALMGPVGTGKSSLVKWLCAKADPAIYRAEVWRADYFHAPLSQRNRPVLYGQNQAQTIEQMMELFDVHLSANPALICVDEATAGLSPKDSKRLLDRMAVMARSRALLVVSHNQAEMQEYSDHVMLLAGGKLQEFSPTKQFFEDPATDAGRQFVGSGWVVTAGVDTPSHHLSHSMREQPFEVDVQAVGAAGRLYSVIEDKLFAVETTPNLSGFILDATGQVPFETMTLVCHESMCEMLDRTGMTAACLPRINSDTGFAAMRTFCRALKARLDAGETAAFLLNKDLPENALSLAMLLIFMGITADKAATVATRLMGDAVLDPLWEQELWDFEMSCDLASDGVDPQQYRVESPDIAWIEAQTLRSRLTEMPPDNHDAPLRRHG